MRPLVEYIMEAQWNWMLDKNALRKSCSNAVTIQHNSHPVFGKISG